MANICTRIPWSGGTMLGSLCGASRHCITVEVTVLSVALASFSFFLPLAALEESVSGMRSRAATDSRFPSVRVHVSHFEVSTVEVRAEDLPLEPGKWIGVKVLLAVDDRGRTLDALGESPVEYLLPDDGWQGIVPEGKEMA